MADKGKCTFGTRMAIDIHMLNEAISREVKHFRNYKIYTPNFGSNPVASKFYAAHDQLKHESEEQTRNVENYCNNVAQTRAKGPHSKYLNPVTENQCYGWEFKPIYPINRNDRRFYHPLKESQYTKIEVIIRMSNPKNNS